jgi:hypothetical protein
LKPEIPLVDEEAGHIGEFEANPQHSSEQTL